MILVTGGLGFIGAHTVRALASLGQRCLAATRRLVPDPDPIPAAKNAAELLAAIVTQFAGPQVVNLRIATIWGPGSASRASAVPNLVHAAVRGEPVRQPVYADDGADLCYVADCARAIALL